MKYIFLFLTTLFITGYILLALIKNDQDFGLLLGALISLGVWSILDKLDEK